MLDYMNFVYVNVGLVMEGIYYRIIDLCNFLYDFKKNLLLFNIWFKDNRMIYIFFRKKIYWINNDDLIILKRIYNIIIGNNFV